MLSEERNGNFTSSEIVALTTNGKAKDSFGAPFYTYIEECNMERRLKRSISCEENARPLSWGKLCERYVCDNPEILGLEYSVNLSDTTRHPTIDCWLGSEDVLKEDTVGDIKSPKTLKSFCQLVDAIVMVEADGVWVMDGTQTMNNIRFGWVDKNGFERKKHPDGEKYYWQLVSNGTIHNKKFAELIVFVPYKSELPELKKLALVLDAESGVYQYSWVANANDSELTYLNDKGLYKNKTVIRFEIPQADKDFLTSRVTTASQLLNK